MSKEGSRRQFDAAFKAEAVRLVTEGGLTQAQAARQLGIEAKRISHWKKQMHQHGTSQRAFPGQGHEHDAELARLRREVATLRMERDLLPKWRSSSPSSPSLQNDEICFYSATPPAVADVGVVSCVGRHTPGLSGLAQAPAAPRSTPPGGCRRMQADARLLLHIQAAHRQGRHTGCPLGGAVPVFIRRSTVKASA